MTWLGPSRVISAREHASSQVFIFKLVLRDCACVVCLQATLLAHRPGPAHTVRAAGGRSMRRTGGDAGASRRKMSPPSPARRGRWQACRSSGPRLIGAADSGGWWRGLSLVDSPRSGACMACRQTIWGCPGEYLRGSIYSIYREYRVADSAHLSLPPSLKAAQLPAFAAQLPACAAREREITSLSLSLSLFQPVLLIG